MAHHRGVTKKINFTIDGTSYEADEGMTWEQWVNSAYNTNGYVANTKENRVDEVAGGMYYIGRYDYYGCRVKLSDVIEENGRYRRDNSPYHE